MPTATPRLLARPAQTWHTLRLLRMARLVLLILDVLLLLAVVSAAAVHRAAIKTIGRDAAPSIIAAQRIKSAMTDMDADAANALLQGPEGATASLDAYEQRRVEAAQALIEAAENITFGEAERAPIQTLQVGLGTYERFVQRARDLHDREDPAAIAAYRQAAALLDTTLLPAADALDGANDDMLERAFKGQSLRSAAARTAVLLSSLLLLVSLVGVQLWLTQRTHRTLHPLLLLGSLLVLVLAVHSVHAVATSHQDLRRAKEDAFTSIHALWRARAAAYAANSEESRALLDPAHTAEHQESFLRDTQAVATPPSGLEPEQLLAAVREGERVDGFTGYLADELNNVTFPGERDAALNTLATWQRYVALDTQIRQLERAGQHRAAVELCTGNHPGQSDYAFAQFDKALGESLAINLKQFQSAVDGGMSVLGSLEAESAAGALAVAVLILLGLAPRIREYV